MKKQAIQFVTSIRFLVIALITFMGAQDVVAQPQVITRAQFNASPLTLQRKYVNNMPDDFEVHDLVNYPVSRTPDDTPRPGVTYMTVYDFYYNVLPGVRLDALVDPQHYFIALDSLSIPTPRMAAPGPAQTEIKQ